MALEAWQKSGGKGTLGMATATGKTMVGLAAAEKLFTLHGSLRVLILAHSRALLDQWRRETIEKLGFVGDPNGDYRNPLNYDDRFVVEFNTLQMVYRDPGAYATDLLIVDEVHHGAGLQFRKALEVPCKWKMGLSATVEGTERGQVLDRHLGKTVYTFTLKEARERGSCRTSTSTSTGPSSISRRTKNSGISRSISENCSTPSTQTTRDSSRSSPATGSAGSKAWEIS